MPKIGDQRIAFSKQSSDLLLDRGIWETSYTQHCDSDVSLMITGFDDPMAKALNQKKVISILRASSKSISEFHWTCSEL